MNDSSHDTITVVPSLTSDQLLSRILTARHPSGASSLAEALPALRKSRQTLLRWLEQQPGLLPDLLLEPVPVIEAEGDEEPVLLPLLDGPEDVLIGEPVVAFPDDCLGIVREKPQLLRLLECAGRQRRPRRGSCAGHREP